MSNKRRRRNAEPEFHVYTPGVAVPPDVTHVLVPAGIEVLPREAFRGCDRLKEVVLPAGLREIGPNAFDNCLSLVCIDLPSTLAKIDDQAFSGCIRLRTVDFPEGLTQIGESAFNFCSSLVRLRLPSTVRKISAQAFSNCFSLEEVILLDGTQEIEDRAFFFCYSLKLFTLPATLTRIARCACEDCPLLETVKLCGGIQRIEGDAFVDSELLDHIKTPSKALLVVAQDDGIHNFHLVTNGAIPRSDLPHVVITSECFNSMNSEDMSQVELTITDILRQGSEWADQHQRLSALVAPHELRHKKEVTTLLELALWKTRMVDSDPAIPKIRGNCRINCGANDIIPNVLPFL